MDKGALLDRVGASGDGRFLLAKVLDRLEQAVSRNIPVSTGFLSPQEQTAAKTLLRLAGVREEEAAYLGGYPAAERKLILFLPDWLSFEDAESQSSLRFLRCTFRPEYGLTHRDFLGSLMGLGIVREKVGDILVADGSCDLITLGPVADFLRENLVSVGRARLEVSEISAEELRVPEAKCEELRDTVSSLRLDSIVATGFRLSRGRAAELIESGRVQVNWTDCVKPDRLLAEGDTVSARGFGKFELLQVGGVTRKGRTGILLKRYL